MSTSDERHPQSDASTSGTGDDRANPDGNTSRSRGGGHGAGDTGRGDVPGDQAHSVETIVSEESGQWVVDVVVVFDDGVVRRRVDRYRTRRRAEIAADWIQRAAARDIEGPLNG